MRNKIIILKNIGLLSFFFSISLYSQNTTVVTSNSLEDPGKIINIKWVSNTIIYPEGVNVYRRIEGNPIWEKLNVSPILKGKYIIPANAYKTDTTLQAYVNMAKDLTPENLIDFTKVFTLLKMVYSNQFALYIGAEFDDSTVISGNTYRYMIKRINGETELFEAISEPIECGEYLPEKAPQGVEITTKDKQVNFKWKVENNRFHSVNIYRRTAEAMNAELITPQPVVLSSRIGPDGKEGYPDPYFEDKNVEYGTVYYYSIAGIDFFGRETERSEDIMVKPMNTTPPPAPAFLESKVHLLDVALEWRTSDKKGIEGLYIYRSPSIRKPFERITSKPLSPVSIKYTDKVPEPGNYYYYVTTLDKDGNEGKSNMTMAQVLDIYPPAIPQKLTAESDSGVIRLRWQSVYDKQLAGYRIYRTVDADNPDFYNLINTQPIFDTMYIDSLPFNARNRFIYRVVSVDSSYNMSEYSNIASAKLPDVTPPDVPFIKEIKNLDGAADISWLPNLEPDLYGYNIFREELIDSVPEVIKLNKEVIPSGKTSFTDINMEKDTEYSYYLKAVDSVGHSSGPSNKYRFIIYTETTIIPVELKEISVRLNSKNNTSEISWQIPQGKALKGVVVFRKADDESEFKPVSGLIKENSFIDDLHNIKIGCVYQLVAYCNTGDKWTSGLYELKLETVK
jgi:fibronectin type 3 domain-containing protein